MNTRQVPSRYLGSLKVLPRVPERLEGLEELAFNLWWAWNPDARALFRSIDQSLWIACEANPVKFMQRISQGVLDRVSEDEAIVALYDRVMSEFHTYLAGADTWYKSAHPDKKGVQIAYFSAEYGLHELLPIYSGGLGVLAGDHLKSASDIGLPFLAVGLLYREGYFTQTIDNDGKQKAVFHRHEWSTLPVRPAVDNHGEQYEVAIAYPGRQVVAKVWKVQVGRIPLYLLDCDHDKNRPEDRKLTSRLYGGDQEMRVQQEILLGIGGLKALRAMGQKPTIFHMNEGHSAFLGLERIREYVHDQGLSFREAIEMVRSTSLFTTHTPVPAGNDAFPPNLIERYFRPWWESIPVSRAEFMQLGLDQMPDGGQLFSMTVLALSLASMTNGVSELHGHVSRGLWQHVWPDVPPREVPIDHITNGIHTRTFLSIDMQELMDQYFPGDWRERLDDPAVWACIDKVPDGELWTVINKLRGDLIDFIHRRLVQQHTRFGESPDKLRQWTKVLHDDVLTIGFARRFATYKRATLLFRDKERLAKMLNNPERPIQIVFAGKAHPADEPGQALIRDIQMISREPAFKDRILFLENYDMNVGRRLTSGVDVWLNTPRRPYEASGTSGMKVPINGGINCSILDGWWVEAYRENPESGWALGEEIHYEAEHLQDEADAESIYNTLEYEIANLFYDRDADGVPRGWLARVRESMKTCAAMFCTSRMVKDYANKFYIPGSVRHTLLASGSFERAKANAQWKRAIRDAWPSIHIHASAEHKNGSESTGVRVQDKVEVVAEVQLGSIDPDDVIVEIYVEPVEKPEGFIPVEGSRIPMHPEGDAKDGIHKYRGTLVESESGEYGYTVRVIPKHPDLFHDQELGLVAWA